MTATDNSIHCLNSLLRGELAATETYQQAMAKLDGTQFAADLRRIHDEHREAANRLRQEIHQYGGKPDQGSGAWGAWAKIIEGTAKVFGQSAALKALKEGEEQGIKDYLEAGKDESLTAETRGLIRSQLLPQTREHITILDRLLTLA
jgi:uncharacterized protein (TIGR02284 family)